MPLTLREIVNHATQENPNALDCVFAVGNEHGHLVLIEDVDMVVVTENTVMPKLTTEQAKFLAEFEPRGFEDVGEPVASDAG